jgi:Fe-S-cluster containining protein
MCDTCHAGCCRAYNLIITVFDALQISRDLNLPVAEFVTMFPAVPQLVEKMGKLHRPLKFSDPGLEDTQFFIALKRVESRLVPGTVKCYFLQEWQRSEPVTGRGDHPGATVAARCGIYGSRPLMCRAYPSFLHEGALGYVTNPAPSELSKSNAIYTLCPEKWDSAAAGADPTPVIHQLVLNKYEIEFQNKLIEEWNANPRTLKEFFPFAVTCYGNRFRVVPEMVATPPAPAAEQTMPLPN